MDLSITSGDPTRLAPNVSHFGQPARISKATHPLWLMKRQKPWRSRSRPIAANGSYRYFPDLSRMAEMGSQAAVAVAELQWRRSGLNRLLQDLVEVVFARANPVGQHGDQVGGGFIAVQLDQSGQRGEQRRMGERAGLYAVFFGLIPGLGQIFQRQLALAAFAVKNAQSGSGGKHGFTRRHDTSGSTGDCGGRGRSNPKVNNTYAIVPIFTTTPAYSANRL